MSPSELLPASTRASDPYEALGTAVFLHILEQLPIDGLATAEKVSKSWRACIREHERSIWREQLLRLNVPDRDVTDLRAQEAAYDRHEPATGSITPSPVDWRAECRQHVLLERNWQKGRCRNKWFRSSGRRVWRFKIDNEEETMFCTTDSCELEVLVTRDSIPDDSDDRDPTFVNGGEDEVSMPLFAMRIYNTHAHLELERGFIYLMSSMKRIGTSARFETSLHPSLPMLDRDRLVSWPHQAAPDLRGQLAHLRVITMPEGCRSYRLHVDKAETPGERVVLLATASDGLHLWDLVDPAWHQHIPCDGSSLGYLELDDEYIFAATEFKTLIFSRTTESELAAFPPALTASYVWPSTRRRYVCQGFEFDFDNLEEAPVLPAGGAELSSEYGCGEFSVNRHTIIPPSGLDRVHQLKIRSTLPEMIEFYAVRFNWHEPFLESRLQEVPPYNSRQVTAVHYTDKHLVCAYQFGYICILRDYREVLATADDNEREARMAENITVISLHERVSALAINGDYIAVAGHSLYWFRASDIPEWQPNEHGEPPEDACRVFPIFRAQSLPVEVTYIRQPSCLQIDRKGIYLAYEARDYADELEERLRKEGRAPRWHRAQQPPTRHARPGGGVVRMWDFTSR